MTDLDQQDLDQQIANLKTALTTCRTIGMAMGILIARRDLDPDQAFDLLRIESQRVNRKLRHLAAEVVELRDLPTWTVPAY